MNIDINLVLCKIVRVVCILAVGSGLINALLRLVKRSKSDFLSEHVRFLCLRGIWYVGIVLLATMLLPEFGFHIGTLLGIAGIAGAAIGFASQTSLSNIISGLFLLTERSFSLGDIVTVSGSTGTVVGIGLLSVKLQQSDGTFVRIPNEELIKRSFVNLTYFDYRRFEVRIVIAYEHDLDTVMKIVRDVVYANRYAAKDKAPSIYVERLQEAGPLLFIGVWAQKSSFDNLKKTVLSDLKNRFQAEKIEMPIDQLTVSIKEHTE